MPVKTVSTPPATIDLVVTRDRSPWRGLTEPGDASTSVAAVADLTGLEPVEHLARYAIDGAPLLAVDRARRRVVVDAAQFGALERVDATRLRPGESKLLGTVLGEKLRSGPRDLALFVVESQLVESFWHVEARLTLVEEKDSAEEYRAAFQGHHVYFTNERNQDRLAFSVVFDKRSGALRVVGD
jgi:hypothetical protein